MIWNPQRECADKQQMQELQNSALQAMIRRIYNHVPFYRNRLMELDIEPGDIKSVGQLKLLPFTTKTDLRDNYPFGLFALPQSEVVRIHASSGTTGKPTVVGYSKADIELWAEVVARSLTMAGVHSGDTIQIAYGYGSFTGGLGLHYGAEKIGATVIPISTGNTKKQLQFMTDFKASVLACTPSYAAHLGESILKEGISPDDVHLRIGVLGAEPWSSEMRCQIEKLLRIKAYDIYGLSEVIGPGVSMECECQCGNHIFEDHFIPEIIDPETLEVLPDGELGELVFTTVSKEAMPLLRYRTRDLTRLHRTKCDCGRTLVRMEKCLGRTDDMLIIRGVNVFPSQVESVLMEMAETTPHYQLIVRREHNLDTLEIRVEVDQQNWSDSIRELEGIRRRIDHNIRSLLGISATIRLVEPYSLARSEGKAQRIIDERKMLNDRT